MTTHFNLCETCYTYIYVYNFETLCMMMYSFHVDIIVYYIPYAYNVMSNMCGNYLFLDRRNHIVCMRSYLNHRSRVCVFAYDPLTIIGYACGYEATSWPIERCRQ